METGISLMELDCHSGVVLVISLSRGAQRVDLHSRRNNANSPTGIYRCDIPTNAVHDDTDNSVRDTVYVGLYSGNGGILSHKST